MKRALFIGRWQPLHPGHKWLFNQKLEKNIPILIAVRDTPVNDSNPFTTDDVINNLEKDWDMILFDSPPLVAVTDATMVSKAIDCIVIVVKVGQTDKKAFEHTIQSLRNVSAPIQGVVLNAVTHKNSYGSYYYYYQYYNYYSSEKESQSV